MFAAADGGELDHVGRHTGDLDQPHDFGVLLTGRVVVKRADLAEVFRQGPVTDQPCAGVPVMDVEFFALRQQDIAHIEVLAGEDRGRAELPPGRIRPD